MIASWTDRRVREALGLEGGTDRTYGQVGTDTRTIGPGSLFVALSGEHHDAHDFLVGAHAAGATGAVVHRGTAAIDGLTFYEVDDTLHALGQLAAYRRRNFAGPVIGITGQNGKTSTKEMVAAVLSTRWRTHRTRANQNNLVGVPLTILEAPADSEAWVVEAGANQPGEIARYREIIKPDIAMVLNAGAGHLEGFGTVAGVVREKLSLSDNAPLAIVGIVPPELAAGARSRARRVVTAGLGDTDVHPDRVSVTAEGRAFVGVDGVEFTLAARGLHQAGNAMFAWAAVRELDLDPVAAAQALEAFTLPGGRGEVIAAGGLTIVNDSYNANPQSFLSAIALTQAMREHRRVVFVAGTMRELGPDASALHSEVAAALVAMQPDVLVVTGDFVAAFGSIGASFDGILLKAPDAEAAGPLLAEVLQGEELVVLKGSRGATLERILPFILPRMAS
ncbi:MAG: UDP-N-acetylmuramoyl-tripeptide--D-alanyl-D-alanine ligase [Gemmatimonadales bacterium]|nr:UDP-N-acetylmuramoyl-tripeptide--D-alanyl-D-alanine ligase [Gemmatimonadales bacterium]